LGHITAIAYRTRALKLVGALACAAFLGGCGGVQFEGKVFDYMGVSGDRKQADPHMTERAPLMVPPNLNKLPEPSPGAAVAVARQDWPDDPEMVRKRISDDKKAQQAEAESKADPMNPYAGKETLLDKLFKPSKTEEVPVPDVPEPDASDRLPSDSAVAQSRPEPLTPHVPQAPLPNRNDEGFNPAAPGSYEDVSGGQNSSAAF
jgi:hypothetical protein